MEELPEKNLRTEGLKRFNYLISETNAVYHEAALKMGLSDSSMMVLYTICNSGDHCLLRDICKLSGASKQTINSALRKLENEGIIYLGNFQGKKKMVYLTDKGKELAKHTVFHLIEMENAIFESWPESEVEQYLKLTQKYLISLKEQMKYFPDALQDEKQD